MYLFSSRFGFKSGIFLLIAPVPVHHFSITYISIEVWIRSTLQHKLLQTNMIFFDQLIVCLLKFGICLAVFMIPIALS